MNSEQRAILDHLQTAAVDEVDRRIRARSLWEWLAFSRARVWSEVLGDGKTPRQQFMAGILLRGAHFNLFGVSQGLSGEDKRVVELLDRARRLYDGSFKHDTCSLKKAGSRIALKGGQMVDPEDIEDAVARHREEVEHVNASLVSLLRTYPETHARPVPERILSPLSQEDLFGSLEQWNKYAEFHRLRGARLKRVVHRLLEPYYDNINADDGLWFTKKVGKVCLILHLDLQSYMAQLCYDYRIVLDEGQIACNWLTFEALLGLGGSGWDCIETEDEQLFTENFLKLDEYMRRLIIL